MKKIILASGSPRRRELMKQVGLDFQVITSDCDESITADSPEETAAALSAIKCSNVANNIKSGKIVPEEYASGYLIIGADTIVVLDGEVLGKPSDKEDAFRMLNSLSGRTHSVITGVTITDTGTDRTETFTSETKVTMFELSDQEIRNYIETGEPIDKAGAYGIQGIGARLIKEIHGDYYTVVGLPVASLVRKLEAF